MSLTDNQIKVLRWITRDLPEETIEEIRASDEVALDYIANSAPSMLAQRQESISADEVNREILDKRIKVCYNDIVILNSVMES